MSFDIEVKELGDRERVLRIRVSDEDDGELLAELRIWRIEENPGPKALCGAFTGQQVVDWEQL